MTEKTNLEAALELAAASLPVFPVHVAYNPMTLKFDKHPCIKGWQTKATADEAAIHEFWHVFPNAVPGLALGQAGLVVLDADRHGGPDGVSAFRDLAARHGLPEGVVRINTAGSGEHWVFRNLTDDPLGNGEGVLPGGINMRGHGGFIVAPGALRPDGQRWREPEDGLRLASSYAAGNVPEIPQWLVDLIRRPNTGRGPSEGSASSSNDQKAMDREQTYAARALEGECTRVAQAPSGSRNESLNKAAFRLGTMAGAYWIEPDLIRSRLFAAAQECGLVRDDGAGAAQGTIESGLKAGMAEPRPPLPPGGFGTIGTIGTHREGVWPEVDWSYLGSGRSDPAPFPIDLLGTFWGSWCQAHAEARCVPVDYVATAVLASASALIGNARWAAASPEWAEPPVLWCAIVGSPSAGKSPALDPVLTMARQIEAEGIEATRPARQAYEEALELARAKAAEWQHQVKQALKKGDPPPSKPADAIDPDPDPVPLPRVIAADTTPERLGTLLRDNPNGLLLNRDEIAGWLGSFGRYSSDGGGERAMWLEAYGGRAYTIDRQKHPEPIIIPHLSIAVLGGIQPDKLGLIIAGADDGFAARFLWCWPEPVSGFRLVQHSIAGGSHLEAFRRLHALSMAGSFSGLPSPSYVSLSRAAAAHFEQYVTQVKAAAKDTAGLLGGALGKAPGHVLRLAMVLEYLDWAQGAERIEPGKISETAMLSAIALMDGYFIPMARRVFGEAAIPEEERLALELARWIVRTTASAFNARLTRRKLGGLLREAKHMTKACEVLIQAGWIRSSGKPTPSGGRTASDYEVNPTLLEEARAA
jgi:hypothetical protein